jgi:SAM-dependent methyltransferase
VDALSNQIQPDQIDDSWFDDYRRQMAERYDHVERLVDEVTERDERVLEAGAVPCQLQALLDEEFDVVGVDVDPGRAKRVVDEHDLDLRRCDLDEDRLPIETNTIQTVVCSEVIEHLLRPRHTLREFRRVLEPGGSLIVTTPNWSRLETLVDWAKGGVPHGAECEVADLEEKGHRGHVRLWSQRELAEMVEGCGFEISMHYTTSFGGSDRPAPVGPALDTLYALAGRVRPFQVVVAQRND